MSSQIDRAAQAAAAKQIILERRERLKTPRAAGVAGLIFALLFGIAMILIRLSIPDDLSGENGGTALNLSSGTISLALTLVPFAGIAFLWFMGVVRDRLGDLEDQFFSTVFFGSGLLFLAMMFVSAAMAGGMIAGAGLASQALIGSGVVVLMRGIMYTITNVYAVRMAGVFMLSLGTIWIRTRIMPRPFVYLTYVIALLMLISVNFSPWLILAFPAWVFVISAYILIVSLRSPAEAAADLGDEAEAEKLEAG